MKYQSDKILKYRNKLNDFLSEGEATKSNIDDVFTELMKLIPAFVMNQQIGALEKGHPNRESIQNFFNELVSNASDPKSKIISISTKLKKYLKSNTNKSSIQEDIIVEGNKDVKLMEMVRDLTFLNTINKMLSEFSSTSAGLMMESFLAVLFGDNAKSIPLDFANVKKEDKEKSVIDIKIGNNTFWSVKLYSTESFNNGIGGSKKFIIEDIFKNERSIDFLVIEKIMKDSSITSLDFYHLNINKNNFEKTLGINNEEKDSILKKLERKRTTTNENEDLASNEKTNTQFKINRSQFGSRFAKIPVGGGVTLKKTYENRAGDIIEKIKPIHNSLQKFNGDLLNYFKSNKETLSKNSSELVASADKIEENSKELTGVTDKSMVGT